MTTQDVLLDGRIEPGTRGVRLFSGPERDPIADLMLQRFAGFFRAKPRHRSVKRPAVTVATVGQRMPIVEGQGTPTSVIDDLVMQANSDPVFKDAMDRASDAYMLIVGDPSLDESRVVGMVRRFVEDVGLRSSVRWETKLDRKAAGRVFIALGVVPESPAHLRQVPDTAPPAHE